MNTLITLMGLLSFLGLEKRSELSTLSNPQQWLMELTGNRSKSGQNVTIENTMGLPALFGAYRIIYEDTASLPQIVYERTKDGVFPVETGKLRRLLKTEPNEMMSSYDLKAANSLSLESTGNYFNRIYRSRQDGIEAIIPLDYKDVVIKKHNTKPKIWYEVSSRDLAGNHKKETLEHDDIEHGRANTLNGIIGRSPIIVCMEAVGRMLATQEYASEFYANGAHVTGILSTVAKLDDEQWNMIRSWWQKRNQNNRGGTAILGSDMKYQRISATPAEAELGNAFNLTDKQINQMLRIPPVMNGDNTRQSNNNREQEAIDYVTHTLRPRVKCMEAEKNRKYWLTPENRDKYFVEFNFDAHLRADSERRAKLIEVLVRNGIMTPNEARKYENMPAIDGGDDLLVMTNMAFMKDLGKITEAMVGKNNQLKPNEDTKMDKNQDKTT